MLICVAKNLDKAHAQAARLDSYVLYGNQSGSGGQFIIQAAPSGQEGPYVHFLTNDNTNSPQNAGSINYVAGFSPNGSGVAHSFQTRSSASGNWDRRLVVLQNGQVRIGATLPDLALHGDYKLAVAGKIVGQSLYITRPASWADHVFAPNYQLRPLPELADYIATNAHLPDVPTTDEVLCDGYDLNQMNARLLQKVEELTLYVIALNQKVAALEAAAPRK